jgi:hypothetical protein
VSDTYATIKIGQWLKLKNALKCAYDTRRAQKLYFKSRAQEDLINAKELEKELDSRLEDLGYKEGG